MDTKIIEKIQKLLSLSESSNENEAKIAMLKVQELLLKYKLSMKEVKEHEIYNEEVKEKVSNISFTKARWKAYLAKIIADNFGCYHYYKRKRTNIIAFLGKEEDIVVCNIVLNYAIDSINSIVKRLKYKYSKQGYSTKGIENDYALGFIKGLLEKFEEQKRANTEWGLVLLKDKEVVEAHKKIKFNGRLKVSAKYNGHNDIYLRGHEAGKKFSITDKITEGANNYMHKLTK
ncbi:hypothetical protein BJV85_001889 [Clostridium acetobutylicum]|uniref:Uncharacterized protein n=1 Tax=Clostridium acetobutylicum (strain ATCC 824 / DSM 792 / JCM 1419 / IAM 19013 / LMG 5710 / NBRC 13948 / NRRL B-527 / VKM B-1787 / 2291 / W) TaxID=272562 RepID=Q97HM4_CLOAB|nr:MULTISPECIES: DUF2786 domain-containing protein [Clostridium]AAK79946.1 Hypothetical protein CA_C1986 [Clostridium acetobutylicum ATCC 824]ADZ21039.1 Conserved hypothetical protein [Clostridium acetobutylicum EA 2018]AEI32116.1 hypothetical protein SMB_G2018 [Clostridium acetobutylicum DSM 1731]AWV79622.1 DUF2786 domain-containing protein [Clostridium acetobutylicum]MBC2394405.1 DUF2786 domain-containing protein [Clostridium acetobutylicum]